VTLKQRRFLLWAATRATAVARHGFDCCFSLSSSCSLSLFLPSFFLLLCVASRHTKTAVTSSLVDAPRVASLLRRKREFEFALFHYACHTHTAQPRCFDLLHGTSTSIRILRINAPVTRLHHLPRGSDRACHIFRGRNRRTSRKTVMRTRR